MKTLALGEPSLFPRRYRGFSGCVCSSTGKYTMLKDEFGIAQTIWEGGQIVGKRNVLRRSIKQNWCLNQVLHKKHLNKNIPSKEYPWFYSSATYF